MPTSTVHIRTLPWALSVSSTSSLLISPRILLNFFKDFKILCVESEDIDLDIFCAWTNSNLKFHGLIKRFIEDVSANSGIPKDQISKTMQLNFLEESIGEVSVASYNRIRDVVKGMVASEFLAIKDYQAVVIVIYQSYPARLHREPLHESEGDIREALPELFEKAVEVHT